MEPPSKKLRGRPRGSRGSTGDGSSRDPPPLQCPNVSLSEGHDWSLLQADLVVKISEYLLCKDVTEYIRFRAVCSHWRQSTSPPSNTESCFRPRKWVLLTSGRRGEFSRRKVNDPCVFLNISTGDYLLVNIPHFRQGYTPISFVDGLLVLLKKRTGALCLLHPFSLSISELPGMASLRSVVPTKPKSIKWELSSVNFLSSSFVIFSFHLHQRVIFAKIRGNRWFGTDYQVRCISSVSFEGKLYAAAWMTGEVLKFELEEATSGSGLDPKLHLTTLIPSFNYPFPFYSGLLEHKGEILRVQEHGHRRFKVHKVDVHNRRLIPTTIPRDHTFFASDSCCLSISTSVSPSILPQSIYYYTRDNLYILVFRPRRPKSSTAHSFYPLPSNIFTYYDSRYLLQKGPYSLPCHLICYCSNFVMPLDSLLVPAN